MVYIKLTIRPDHGAPNHVVKHKALSAGVAQRRCVPPLLNNSAQLRWTPLSSRELFVLRVGLVPFPGTPHAPPLPRSNMIRRRRWLQIN